MNVIFTYRQGLKNRVRFKACYEKNYITKLLLVASLNLLKIVLNELEQIYRDENGRLIVNKN